MVPWPQGGGENLAAAPCWGPPSVTGPLPAAGWGRGAPSHAGRCVVVTVAASSRGLLSASCFLQGWCSVHLGSALYFLANAGLVILKRMVQPPCLIKLAPCRTLLDVLCLSPHQRRSVRCWLQEQALLAAGLVSKQEGPEQAWNFSCLAPTKSFPSLGAGQALLQLITLPWQWRIAQLVCCGRLEA